MATTKSHKSPFIGIRQEISILIFKLTIYDQSVSLCRFIDRQISNKLDHDHEYTITLIFQQNIDTSFNDRNLKFLRACNQINTTDATSGAGTTYPSGAPGFTSSFQWASCYSIFSFICMLCRWLFVLLYFFFWPLCCLLFFDIRILITPLISCGHCVVCPSSTYEF